MRIKSLMLFIVAFAAALTVLLTNGCHGVYLNESQAAQALKSKEIRVGIAADLKKKSVDKDLILAFLKTYKLKYSVQYYNSIENLNTDFKAKELDLVVVRNSFLHSELSALDGPAYDDLMVSLFCRSQDYETILVPKQLQFLTERASELESLNQDHLQIVDATLDQLADQAYQTKKTCFIAETKNSKAFAVTSRKFQKVWTSEYQYPVAWQIQSDQIELNKLSHIWFQNLSRENKVSRFWDQHNAPQYQMSVIEYRRFREDIKNVLPQWKKIFEKHARQYDIPWTLIAAVAYQESKWDNTATSYTGVKGLMQLTKQTAEHLGIDDREDPLQSIQGGSFYLKYLYDKTPTTLLPFERWIQALAAYNMGWAHLRDGHRLARHKGMDPYRWTQFKKVLPLMTDEQYSEVLNFGPARGHETVDFIEGVLNYYDLLNSQFTQRSLTSRDF